MVYKHLIDTGYEVVTVRKELEVNPQILAKLNDEYHLVIVKTKRFPEMGVLFPHVASQVMHLAEQRGGKIWFGSVGIANGDVEEEELMTKPMKSGKYIINFKGLMPVIQE